jgi:hypothetical protein
LPVALLILAYDSFSRMSRSCRFRSTCNRSVSGWQPSWHGVCDVNRATGGCDATTYTSGLGGWNGLGRGVGGAGWGAPP